MASEHELQAVVSQLEDLVEAATTDTNIPSSDLRRVLAFLAKVVQIVDQAFQDVFALLIEFKYLSITDKTSGRLDELRKELDLVLARSKYRDAEEICSRLHHLKNIYHAQIQPLVTQIGDSNRWWEVLALIDEREGRIIFLIEHAVRELNDLLGKVTKTKLPQINSKASEMAEAIRGCLQELRWLGGQIMGLSGQPGFLELTADRTAFSEQARIFINRGAIRMSRDSYSAGQAGAMGPGAHAHDMTFQQIWNQSASSIDLPSLARELAMLRQALKSEAKTGEQDVAVGEVAAAEAAATKGDGPTVLQRLKAAGKWVLDVAVQEGLDVAAAALKTALGL